MSLLTTSAASIHQLGAAAAVADIFLQNGTATRPGETTKSLWSKRKVIANVMLAAGWMIEQRTIRKRHIDRETDDAVSMKDLCVIGAALTNVANMVADQMMKREFPEGIPAGANGGQPTAAKYRRYFEVTTVLNRIFAAGAIGFTPFVNFNVLRSYKPGTLYRLFT